MSEIPYPASPNINRGVKKIPFFLSETVDSKKQTEFEKKRCQPFALKNDVGYIFFLTFFILIIILFCWFPRQKPF